jgi:TetR/AcrR family transcriptional regulator, repressor for uid operon
VTATRRGRPPAADAGRTRARVLGAARRCFVSSGYAATTTRQVAAEAGLTAPALYHYVESKPALYAAVVAEVHDHVYGRFGEAVAGRGRLVDRVDALLGAALAMHHDDPTLAAFVAAVPDDVRRHPELAALRPRYEGDAAAFFARLVAGCEDDLAPGVDPQAVVAMLMAVTAGLARFAMAAPAPVHEAAVGAFARLLDGTLLRRDV